MSAAKNSSVRRTGRALPDLSIWQTYQRVSGGMTPARISAAIAEADNGRPLSLIDMANAARQKDCHLQSVLAKREKASSRGDYVLKLPGGVERSRPLTWCRATLEELAPKLHKLIEHLSSAVYHGFAVAEIVWKKVGTKLVPADFILHSPRRFEFDTATGKLVWRDAGSMTAAVDFQKKWPNRFIVSQPRVNGDVPHREGLARCLLWAWLFRNWTTADWAKLAELAWKPWRTGEYKKGASQEDIDNLEQVLAAMSSNGIAVVPETTKLTFQWPTGGGGSKQGSHKEFIDSQGAEMSKAVLGGTLTTEQGDKGARSLGEVHQSGEDDLFEDDQMHIAAVLSEQLITPMVRLNFTPSTKMPVLCAADDDDVDILNMATAIEKLVGPVVRMRVGEKWARSRLGIPEPQEKERVLGGSEADETDDQPGQSETPSEDDSQDEPDTQDEEAPDQ